MPSTADIYKLAMARRLAPCTNKQLIYSIAPEIYLDNSSTENLNGDCFELMHGGRKVDSLPQDLQYYFHTLFGCLCPDMISTLVKSPGVTAITVLAQLDSAQPFMPQVF